MLLCALSNELPESPVLSPKSNAVFERRLIEKYIADRGTDPVNGEPLTVDELIDIKQDGPIRARPPTASSIPGMLSMFQNEWDAVVLETYQLKQQLSKVRLELSHTLYQHEAACRVIARLNKENAQLRAQLGRVDAPGARAADSMDVDPKPAAAAATTTGPLAGELVQRMEALSAAALEDRRARKTPATLASAEGLQSLHESWTATVGELRTVAISALDDLVLAGSRDGTATLFAQGGASLQNLTGHKGRLTAATFAPGPVQGAGRPTILTASHDRTVRVWADEADTGYKTRAVVECHTGPVTSAAFHPLDGTLALTTSLDATWAFLDVTTGRTLHQQACPVSKNGIIAADIHPDGLIFGSCAGDSQILIWDLRSAANIASLSSPDAAGANIDSLTFSQNGYYLSSIGRDNTLRLWDLRKSQLVDSVVLDWAPTSSTIDASGTYLTVGGEGGVSIFRTRKLKPVCNVPGLTSVASVAFGKDARTIVVGGDSMLRVFSVPE
ncbi:hypothetical protein H696_02706 [Fonticula alba]|uniref:Pre-mRNA-processing factor 19 n=1 Tax=Fonticula alba TaxID=691883 RepID=A0A058ZA13_FONAL|nr:hypothetical protein H696_02706 [Fonticula alba]KCV70372.1 hypothetical protein H696_02706 [Fonticula alba]|eukprot:XP_009494888.1 hypothetical protein H696_02706 [Fonticula alba]